MGRKKLTPEQEVELHNLRVHANFQREIAEKLNLIIDGNVSNKPTRFFEVGQRVIFGGFGKSWVKEVLSDGALYILGVILNSRESGDFEDQRVAFWHDVFPYKTIEHYKEIQVFNKKFDYGNVFNQPIDSLFHRYYWGGIDMNPEYQRGNVWEIQDKISLIDSIFNDIEIGRIVLMNLPYNDERKKQYEIIDGKQRLSTLVEFFEDRFKYNGLFFSEMHPLDKHHFTNKQLAIIEVDTMPRELVLEYFIRINTSGRPVDINHLNKVKKMKTPK